MLANHLLIRCLHSRLRPPARIVITVSDTHFGDLRHNLAMVPGPRWRAPDELARPAAFPNPTSAAAGRMAYSTSKLAAIHLVHEWARRLPRGIDVLGYNPGFVPGTALARDATPFTRFAMRWIMPALVMTPLGSSVATAGSHLARVALDDLSAPTGGYIDRQHVARSSERSYDHAREQQLWDAVQRLTEAFVAQT